MKDGPNLSTVAALIGDPARANMLSALMDGRALTASELAAEAGVTVQTASSHLGKLTSGGLLTVRAQGRHRYFALAGEPVATALEALMSLAENHAPGRTRTGPRDAALRQARVCYNHLAGRMGVQMYDALLSREALTVTPQGLHLSARGHTLFADLGVPLDALTSARAPLCRECLDWSERRSHLAGSLGRAALTRFLDLGWAARDPASRAVVFSTAGAARFGKLFPA